MLLRLAICTALMLAGPIDRALAGAWTQPARGSYLKLSYAYSTAGRVLNGQSGIGYDSHALYFYGEVGVTNQLTLIASVPVLRRAVNQVDAIRGTTRGAFSGDIEPRVRYGILQRQWAIAIEAGGKIPAGYETIHDPPFGNGETDFDLGIAIGRSLFPLPAYFSLNFTHRWRGGDFIDEFRGAIEAGWWLRARWMLKGMADGVTAVRTTGSNSDLFGFPLDQEQLRVGGAVVVRLLDRMELDLTWLQTIGGENVLRSSELFLGVALKSGQ